MKGGGGEEEEAEVVRHAVELPRLPEWCSETGPIDYSDWLLLLSPIMSDLFPTSEDWWTQMLATATQWYESHLKMSPLERLSHRPVPTASLLQRRWMRLERRSSALLLAAIPEGLREEVVSTKNITTLGILSKGLVQYQPGGLAERSAILAALENPQEAQTVGAAVATLRKWQRWKRRAEELKVSIPDPTLLAKGLGKLMKKVMSMCPELAFRLQLVKSSLMVDSVPSHDGISKYAENLMAELEQVNQQSKKRDQVGAPEVPRLKRFEENGKEKIEKENEKPRREGDTKDKPRCKFYLTDQGCRRGKGCSYAHEGRDEKRRCWNCGAIDHMAPQCPRPKEVKEAPKTKVLRSEKEREDSKKEDTESSGSPSTVKDLLDEANRVLKSLGPSTTPSPQKSEGSQVKGDVERQEVVDRLQAQLNALRKFRLRKMRRNDRAGLLDSGATHPLRPIKEGEDIKKYHKVQVSLADGQAIWLPMSPGGAMVSEEEDIEPILPMGMLTEVLGCEVTWSRGSIQVVHPEHGELPVEEVDGCPQMPRKLALQMIGELEEVKKGMKFKEVEEFEKEMDWMRRLVEVHPVLSTLPDAVKEKLVVQPGSWATFPANRRRRKAMKRDGFICHLYAGEEEGFTLARAWKQAGGGENELLEVDLKRGTNHDMMPDSGPYAGLLRAVLEDKLLGLIGGPNCRSRSVLRHYPVEGEDPPRPIRRWGHEEFGIDDATEAEKKKLYEDDVMMWRMIFLSIVSQQLRKARRDPNQMLFSMEQPASPKDYMPEVVSIWDTSQWKALKKEMSWEEITIHQKALGGSSAKPTTFGGNLRLSPEDHEIEFEGKRMIKSSADLARWPPGVMNMVAKALLEQVMNRSVRIRALSWSEHIALGHIPARRDCKVCQENMQQGFPHRRVLHLRAGVLSLDTAGPLLPAYDQGGCQTRYFLVGTLTWAVPSEVKKHEEEEEKLEELLEGLPDFEEAEEEDEKEEEEAEAEGGYEVPGGGREDGRNQEEDSLLADLADLADDEEEEGEEEEEQKAVVVPLKKDEKVEGPPDDFRVEVYRLALPMQCKKSREVTKTVMEMILRLRMDGYNVNQVHTDQGHEFAGYFPDWCRRRGIAISKTAGDDPQGNGRAEVTVKVVKNMVRKALSQGGVNYKWWPWALRHCNEIMRSKRLHEKVTFPAFMDEVLVRKRKWKKKDWRPTMETVRYLYPSKENHGHHVVKDGETPRLTRCIVKKIEGPPVHGHWIALERELLDGLSLRRRLREKTSIKKIQKSPEDEEDEDEESRSEERKKRLKKVLEDEMKKVLTDPPELAVLTLQVIAKLRRMLTQAGLEEEEEVLQTRIVSPKEVAANWEQWIEASRSEVHSLIEEKEALKPLKKHEVKKLIEDAEKRGVKVEVIPSKLVFAKKPGKKGGKKKVRWVVCGNFETKSPNEENFSSGADSAAFRIMVWVASKFQWEGTTLDVKTAFLNAEMVYKDGEHLLLVAPPSFFTDREFLEKDTFYVPAKAVYGFRRSPRLWGEHRDQALEVMEIEVEKGGGDEKKMKLKLQALESEPNLWKVIEEGDPDEVLQGLLMTYVDDLFVVGPSVIVNAVKHKIQNTWTTSSPEDVSRAPVKFLGMEVQKGKEEESGREVWAITQESYVTDLLEGGGWEKKMKKIPISKDQSTMQPDAEKPEIERIRSSQKQVGEMLWLVTRTRPDLMFGVSRMAMGASVLKATDSVHEAAQQMKGYLWRTRSEGLIYKEEAESEMILNVYTDASFAPDSEESHGSFVILLENSPIFWRSGRQGLVTLSTAESEMNEVIEGMVAGESIGVIIEELFGFIPKMLWTDSMSGLAIVTNDGGSWRTRHLRTRSAFARQAVQQGLWGMAHVPGERMLADIGTKPLSAPRLEDLKRKMRMGSLGSCDPKEAKQKKEDTEAAEKKEDAEAAEKKEDAEAAEKKEGAEAAEKKEESQRLKKIQEASAVLKLIALVTSMTGVKAEDPEEEQRGYSFEMMLLFYTAFIVTVTSFIWWFISSSEGHAPQEMYSTRRFNRRTLMGMHNEEEDEGSEEDEYGNVHEVPRPRGLPDEDWQGSTEACGSEAAWDFIARGKGQRGEKGESEKGGGKKGEGKKGRGKKGEARGSEEEESVQIQTSKRNRVQQEISQVIEEAATTLVLTTRYGRAHHGSYDCDALIGREVRPSPWCPRCLRSTGPSTVLTLKAASWGGPVHTNHHCEALQGLEARNYTPCLVCRRDG